MVESNKPSKTYKARMLSLSVWEKEGEKGTMKTYSFQKSYKDDKGEWRQTQNLLGADLPIMSVLLKEAYRDSVLKS